MLARPTLAAFRSEKDALAYRRAHEDLLARWPGTPRVQDLPTRFGPTRVTTAPGPEGGGAPVVLLPGLGGAGPSWHALVGVLGAHRPVVCPDTLGVAGLSRQTTPFRGDEDLARWFLDLLDALELEQVHLYGESQGSWHAALVAQGGAARLRSLTLVEPNGWITRTPWRALMRFVRLSTRSGPEAWEEMAAWLTPGVRVLPEEQALARAALPFRSSLGYARVLRDAELARLSDVPVTVVLGERSVLLDVPRTLERLRRVLPEAQVTVVDGAGHGVRAQRPERVEPLILDALARHEAGPVTGTGR